MARSRLGAIFLMAAPIWAVFTTIVAGIRYPHYSHVTQFISELGAHGARDGFAVSWGGFFVVGTLVGVGALLLWPTFKFAMLAGAGLVLAGLSTTLGYVGSAVWRCDFGCPEEMHSSTQSVHFGVSAADLIGVAIGIALVAWALRHSAEWRFVARLSLVVALVVWIGGFVLLSPSVEDVKGLAQRSIELTTYVWFFVVGRAAYTNGTQYAQAP